MLVMKNFLHYAKKDSTIDLLKTVEHYEPKELVDYIKEFDFQHSDMTDEEWHFSLICYLILGFSILTTNLMWARRAKMFMLPRRRRQR